MYYDKPLIAFLGYVLPYGQMSLWGLFEALNVLFNKSLLPQSITGQGGYSILNYNLQNLDLFLIYSIMPLIVKNKNLESKILNKKLRGIYRIGPHNQEIYSIIFGSLLGDAFAEKRLTKQGGTRISFYQENVHLSYIIWLHNIFSIRGYTNARIPQARTRLGTKGVVRKIVRFHTWTYTSFNWIHDLWYVNNVKKVPNCIADYLTPLALAIWIMDDGSKVSKGLKLCTNSFSYSDCVLLVKSLNDKFSLKASIFSAGAPNQYNIYIWKQSMPLLRNIVLPHIIPEMKYKILD